MECLSVRELAAACKGTPYGCENLDGICRVCTDTRKIEPGDMFVPLRGENFDGHDFIGKAFQAGAALTLTADLGKAAGKPCILVEDTLNALQDIARYYKGKFKIPFVAITGSSGKTTTKDMIASVLGAKYNVLKTEGNLNNAIGVPLTLLKLEAHHQIAVVEMGMNSLGEIELLADIVRPDIGVISNVGTAHIEKLGSRENILKAKLELFTFFGRDNTAIINGDNDLLGTYASGSHRIIKYGLDKKNDIMAYNIEEMGEQGISFRTRIGGREASFLVPVPGLHNVYNALAAITVGLMFDMTAEQIREGLASFRPSKMRMDIFTLKNGIRIINDVYNANPDSMLAAINVLKSIGTNGRTVAILGNMMELGEVAAEKHYEVGRYAAETGIDTVISVGGMAKQIAAGAFDAHRDCTVYSFDTNEMLQEKLQGLLEPGDTVLIKGSRVMKMESIVDFLRERG